MHVQKQGSYSLSSDSGAGLSASNVGMIQAVASAGPLLVLFAFTVPLTTLTSTAEALSAGSGAQAWILSAMSVGAAAGLLSSGAVGDDYGRRRTFVIGCLLLAFTSLLAAISPNGPLLIVARVLQGIGGGCHHLVQPGHHWKCFFCW